MPILKKKRGGTRPGAGRKIIGSEKRDTIAVCLEPHVIKALDVWAHDKALSRSEAMNQVLQQQLEPSNTPKGLTGINLNKNGHIMAIYAGQLVFNLTTGAWVPWSALDVVEVIYNVPEQSAAPPELTPRQSAKLDRDLKNAVDNLDL